MAAGKINLQANDTRIYEITAEDGAGSNVAITLPKEGGMLVVDAEVVHKTGNETIAGVKTFSSNVGIGTSSPIGTLDVTQKNSDTANDALILRGYTTGANGTRNCNIKAITSDAASWADLTFKAYRFNFSNQGIGTGFKIDEVGNVLVTSAGGLGYGTGSGGTVTQLTSKSTAVTLNKPCGSIVTAPDSIPANTVVSFLVNNTAFGTTDSVVATLKSDNIGSTPNYLIWAQGYTTGQFMVHVWNRTGGALAQSIVITFEVFKGVIA